MVKLNPEQLKPVFMGYSFEAVFSETEDGIAVKDAIARLGGDDDGISALTIDHRGLTVLTAHRSGLPVLIDRIGSARYVEIRMLSREQTEVRKFLVHIGTPVQLLGLDAGADDAAEDGVIFREAEVVCWEDITSESVPKGPPDRRKGSPPLQLTDTNQEWDDLEANFGNTSILSALLLSMEEDNDFQCPYCAHTVSRSNLGAWECAGCHRIFHHPRR